MTRELGDVYWQVHNLCSGVCLLEQKCESSNKNRLMDVFWSENAKLPIINAQIVNWGDFFQGKNAKVQIINA